MKWKLYGTGPAIVSAFAEGALDLAYMGIPPAIIGMDRGVRITCISGGHVEGTVICGASRLKGYPEISRLDTILKQLAGHKLGVPGKGSIHDVIISESLRTFDLQKDIQVINFQWADQVLEALHRGNLSAAAGTPALAVAVQRFAHGRILYPPSELWPNNPSYGIVVRKDVLHRRTDEIESFLKSHEDAGAFLRNSTSEAARIIARYVGVVDEEFVLDTLMLSPRYCACLTDEYIAASTAFSRVLKELGYIRRDISADEIFDLSLIRKIHPGKDHYHDPLHPG
ncbi:MAG: ABC transporter substrate-binding protein [Nitrospiraceae bacterium]|nr:MAG: ABC transporter substrate-binding protein [Nitrospiraceae bacterium]